jgi:two-component sensor histidine kinase
MMENNSPASQQVAEYAMAFDLISQLTQVLDETRVLPQIMEIFAHLFAPRTIIFHIMEDGAFIKTLTYPENLPVQPPPPVIHLDTPEITPAGFRLAIPYKGTTVGIIGVDGIAFPEYRERYLSLALDIAGVCGLSIVNARTHSRLETAMSDLSAEFARSTRLAGELKDINEHLEERIRQRTAELEEEALRRKGAEEKVRSQLEEKTLLLRELHHRVRNNLQLITSMLSIQARKIPDPTLQMAISESRNRIRTMAMIHEKLWSEDDFAQIRLDALARQIFSNLLALYHTPPGQITLSMDSQPVVIDINTAIPLSFIINELISNSLKYAFPGGQSGEITVEIREDEQDLVIRLTDNGIGLPPGFDWENSDTVGLILVNSLVQQLQGTIEREPGNGTRFMIRIPWASGNTRALRGTYNLVTM